MNLARPANGVLAAFCYWLLALAVVLGGVRATPAEEKQKAPELEGGVAWLNTATPSRFERTCGARSSSSTSGRSAASTASTHCPTWPSSRRSTPTNSSSSASTRPSSTTRRTPTSIRKAILRYEIAHPVVNDADTQDLGRATASSSWPTLVLIDPEGNIVGVRLRRGQLRAARQGHRQAHQGAQGEEDAQREAAPVRPGPLPREAATARCSSPARCWPTSRATACSSPTARTTASSLRTWTARRSPSPAPARRARRTAPSTRRSFNDPQGMAARGRHALRRRPQEPPASARST